MQERSTLEATAPTKEAAAPDSYDRDGLVRRLNRIEGQVRGIRRMIDESRSCLEVLQQVAAAEAALNRISFAVFKHHVDYCVAERLDATDADCRQKLNELVDIFDRFGK